MFFLISTTCFFTKLILFLDSATTTATYNANDDDRQVVAINKCPDDATRIVWAFDIFFSLLCVFFTKLIFFLYSATTTVTLRSVAQSSPVYEILKNTSTVVTK